MDQMFNGAFKGGNNVHNFKSWLPKRHLISKLHMMTLVIICSEKVAVLQLTGSIQNNPKIVNVIWTKMKKITAFLFSIQVSAS